MSRSPEPKPRKAHPTVACCGIDCGLCPRYYTEGSSRCPGCAGPDFFDKHPSCSILTCCVQKRGLETCADCEDFPCPKIAGWDTGDSFVAHKRCLSNLKLIKEQGMQTFLRQQRQRMQILEQLLGEYDEGRSKSFYCLSTALLPIDALKEVLVESKKEKKDVADLRQLAECVKSRCRKAAEETGIELIYRRGKA